MDDIEDQIGPAVLRSPTELKSNRFAPSSVLQHLGACTAFQEFVARSADKTICAATAFVDW